MVSLSSTMNMMSPTGQDIAITCIKGRLCCDSQRSGFSFIFTISWESWDQRVVSDCVWFRRSPDLFTLRRRSCESMADTTALFCGTLCFYAPFHTALSRGASQQQQGTAELQKLAILLFIFLGPRIGVAPYKSVFSCSRVALVEQA